MQVAQVKSADDKQKETEIEYHTDQRARIIGTQQSEMINQRKTDGLPKNFESSGFDSLGSFGIEQFEPTK